MTLFTMGRFPSKGDLRQYEDDLQERAYLVRVVQPRVQETLTSVGRFASRNVVLGRENWLFYRPGVDSLTGRGFLDPIAQRHRVWNLRDAASAETISPDPRPAIIEFQRQVRAAGAYLVLMPIPDKAAIQTAQLSGAETSLRRFPVNASWAQFLQEMRAAGVDVFDPTPADRSFGQIRYLRHDTHWTPQWMDEVAGQLAAHIRPRLSAAAPAALQLASATTSGMGDLVEMLRLTDSKRLFPAQQVMLECVQTSQGQILRPDKDSEVLLLGDSFANIFSASQLGWGES
ncbi:MAG: hypothetical protein WCI73_07525, partial [Phycisphaerae bacterium]